MQTNPKDPLAQAPDQERALFECLTHAANGFQREQVIGAAANLIVNALRQTHATQRGALDDFDRIASNMRNIVAAHYDQLGKRRNVFPFHQKIEVPLFDAKNGRSVI